ncbi:MAG TPA: lipopolysaccharide heptosyltransferase II [Candidatus Omnitrophota bacterium]|nr:lipopolysaccharide heptosyltransferase II [Candidatus Omnitrophota bacterium]HOX09888.1 lipopolysaccharide heptosyltransferase II [Candidatus Omnitrophota bacterium]
MKIVQILPRLNTGGVETGVVDLSERLIKLGHNAVVISGGGELVKKLEAAGIKHYTLPVGKKDPFTILRMIPAVCRILRSEKADILHARSRVPAMIGYYAARRAGVVFITTCHGYYSKKPFSKVMGWGKYVIAISQVIAKHMMDSFKVPYRRIKLIYRGVNLERFRFKEPDESVKSDYTIGIIGRLTPLKGHAYFFRAAAKALKYFPRLKVLVVGDASPGKERYRQELQDTVRRLGLEKHVEFLGRRSDIPEILAGLDLLVLATTVPEGFGRVIIEAFAAGVPVVATSVGGVTEIIRDGVNGLLVPPEDPQAMSDAIVRMLKDRALTKGIVRNARKDAEEKFNLDRMITETVRVYEEALERKRILVIKISAVGDCVLATPSLRAIRQKNPKAYIALLTGRMESQALKGCPYVDEFIIYDRNGRDRGWLRFLELAAEVRRYCFEEVVDLQNNSKSHIFAIMSTATKRYGYRKGWHGLFLNKAITDNGRPIPPVDHQFRVLSLMGIEGAPKELELWPSAADEGSVRDMLETDWVGDHQALVAINPGASPRWATKRWPAENFAKLCDLLAQKEIRPVIIGTKADSEAADLVISMTRSKPVNLTGKTTITELAALMKRMKCLVTSDSAPMHVAAAMKTPFVALFGPTDPARHLPPSQACAVVRKGLRCAPCYKPVCSDIRCMREIEVEDVMRSIEKLLAAR